MFIDKIKLPKNLNRYVLRNVAPSYLYINEKEGTMYCTACGSTTPLVINEGHNQERCCPRCKSFATTKLNQYGRKQLMYRGGIFWLQKDGKNTLGALAGFKVDYRPDKEPEVSYYPEAAYQLSAEKQEYYRYTYDYARHMWLWEPRQKIILPQIGATFKYSDPISFYGPSISELGTALRYLDFENISPAVKEELLKWPNTLFNYLLMFIRHKSTELLVKAGFEMLVIERARGNFAEYNMRGKTLEKILKMPKGEIKKLPRSTRNYELRKYKRAKEIFPHAGPEVIKLMDIYAKSEALQALTKYEETALYKYLIKNEIQISDYIDYLKDIKALMLPETKRTLRPKNFYEEHEKLANRRAEAMLKQKNKDFVKNEKKIAFGPYEEDDYIITIPKSPVELVKEGEAQHHCVGTYVDRVASGKCAIVFLRKKENPKKPFYTIELSPDREIVQCRGEYNSTYDDEIKGVLKRYKRWLKEEYHEWIKNAG